jgi:hypothetical protein
MEYNKTGEQGRHGISSFPSRCTGVQDKHPVLCFEHGDKLLGLQLPPSAANHIYHTPRGLRLELVLELEIEFVESISEKKKER